LTPKAQKWRKFLSKDDIVFVPIIFECHTMSFDLYYKFISFSIVFQ